VEKAGGIISTLQRKSINWNPKKKQNPAGFMQQKNTSRYFKPV